MGLFDGGLFGGPFEKLLSGGKGKDIYGSKPVIPEIETLAESQGKAVKANVTNFQDIAELAVATDIFNQQQLEKLMDMRLPGARQIINENIMSRLRGEIPDDVRSAISRGNSERFAGVFSGSDFARSLEAKQLGLTSLDLMDSAQRWIDYAKAPVFDVTTMFVTPAMQQQQAMQQFERNLIEAKVDAAPDPVARGRFDTSMAIIGMALSAYGGGPGYQGTYNQGQNFQGFGGGGSQWAPPASTQGPGGFYMGIGNSNNWGFGRTSTDQGGRWFMGSQPGPDPR